MELVNFTKENLSKIHISQFEQFLDKRDLKHGKNNRCVWFGDYYTILFSSESGLMRWHRYESSYVNVFDWLFTFIDYDYVQGDLTQFHVLFTQVYNEIMSYSINEKE
jgi:hypothetical protein